MVFEVVNLIFKLGFVVVKNTAGNNRTRNSSGATKSLARRNKHVRNILVFTQKRQMQQNRQRLCIGSQDDQIGDTAVQGLRG